MMLGAGVKNMLAKRKAKKVQNEVKEVAPQVIKGLSGMPRLREPDRSPDEIPTQSMRARMTGYYPSATPRYNDAARTGLYKLNEGQVALAKSGPEGKKAVASMENKSVEEISAALPRKMAFCSGSSKPYKKK